VTGTPFSWATSVPCATRPVNFPIKA
jgi:hypothetical protein